MWRTEKKIDDSFVSVAQRAKRLRDICVAYDVITTLEIPKLLDPTSTNMNTSGVEFRGISWMTLDVFPSRAAWNGLQMYFAWDTKTRLRTRFGFWLSLKMCLPVWNRKLTRSLIE